ncbi:MAG TPA: class I SAM-dependent methyltransferase [Crocinitomix sp.]|nr:class I SAM-dependent methyltransferase [Crocinitomix sp.]
MISNKDNPYWNKFYSKKELVHKPSSFALSIVDELTKGKKLLELGCGNGRDSFFFDQNGIKVIALDLSKDAIAINKLKKSNVNFIEKDFTNIKLDEYLNIDYVYSRFSLHSIEKKDYLRTIEWVSKQLKKSGKFFIEARTVNDPLFGKGEKMADDAYVDTHYRRFFRIKEVMKELKTLGFEITHSSENYTDSWYKDDHAVVMRIICEKK